MAHDRNIAGIRCTEILAGLSDYLAGELPPEVTQKVQAHLAECSWCDHFGGEFTTVVRQLRIRLLEPESPTPQEADRLMAFLELDETA